MRGVSDKQGPEQEDAGEGVEQARHGHLRSRAAVRLLPGSGFGFLMKGQMAII
jgi:hypothetical protein